MRKKKSKEIITIITYVPKTELPELYAQAAEAAINAGWQDWKFLNTTYGKCIKIERTK